MIDSRIILLPLTLAAALGAQAPATLHRFDGAAAQDQLGWSVRGAGDVDGDGFDDLIAGAYGDDTRGANAGAVQVFSGRDGSLLYRIQGDAAGDRFGAFVAAAGDVDGDGFADLLVGAPRADANGVDSGLARVYSGRTGSVLHDLSGDAAGDQFGTGVAGLGDVDGDGHDDFAVGAPLEDDGGPDAGSVRVFSGRTGAVLRTLLGDGPGDRFGFSVAGPGDVDGDGFADVLVGAYLDDDSGFDSGSAKLFSGRTGAVLHTFLGDAVGDWFGRAVAAAGDVDRDGVGDLVVGAHLDDDNGTNSGSARVYSGATGAVLHSLVGNAAGEFFGYAVGGAGDVDGDGHDDLVVGAYPLGSGRARVFSGRTGAVVQTFVGDAAGDWFGFSVGGAGDADGDGFADFAVGAPQDDRSAVDAGSVRILTMGYTGTPATARSVGRGCAGSNGHLPRAGHVGRPFLGTAVRVSLRGALPSTAVLLNLGAPTAIDLTAFGFGGCSLYATADGFVVAFSTDANGMARSGPITVPNVPALVGQPLVAQWICPDRTANAGGFTLSDAIRLGIGR
jgi:hypothetical protein